MHRRPVLGLLVWFALASPAIAEEATSWRDHVTLTLSDRVRGEFVEWFRPRPILPSRTTAGVAVPVNVHRYAFVGNQARAGLRLVFPAVEVGVDVQDTRLAGLPDDATFPPPIGPLGPGAVYYLHSRKTAQGETFLKQAFLTLRRGGFSLTGGRFDLRDGLETVPADATLAFVKRNRIAERLVGPFDFTHVTRSFDGLRVAWDRPEANVTAFWAHPTYGGFEVSANRGFEEITLVGLALTGKRFPWPIPTDARLFYLFYEDARRAVPKVDNRPAFVRADDLDGLAIHTIGAHLLAAVDAGPGIVDLLGWAAGQTGTWASLGHSAWAWALEAGYQLARVWGTPWLRVGWNRSSGDDRPDDGAHDTFFQVLPTARIYAQFPFYNLMNNDDVFASFILRPHPRVTLRTDYHRLRLTEARDLWYGGGGAVAQDLFGFSAIPSSGRRDLADLVDVSLAVQIVRWMTVQAYYGRAFGHGVVRGTFAGRDAHYGFVEVTARY